MPNSSCTISFFRNDLQRTKLPRTKLLRCPVKNCSMNIYDCKVPFQKHKNQMRYLPYCPEHGIRIHEDGFVYYNGSSKEELALAIRRNLMFHSHYYIKHFLESSNKIESKRLCYESSEDAVSYNVFTELASNNNALQDLVREITKPQDIKENIELYLWGNKIDLQSGKSTPYSHLKKIREHLEKDIRIKTEPDIMLIVPKKLVICIEAKFGSKNPIAVDKEEERGEKPKKVDKLIERYYNRNKLIKRCDIFDFPPKSRFLFYEQIFRNIVFAASMAQIEEHTNWFVVNLRSQHVMNLNRGKPESRPVMRSIQSILKSKYKKRFLHLTWEEIYKIAVEKNPNLYNLIWYLKNKSLNCSRAFNI